MDPKPRVSSPRANPSSSYSLPMLNYFDTFTFNYIFRYFPILKVGHSLEIDLTFFLKKKKKRNKKQWNRSLRTLWKHSLSISPALFRSFTWKKVKCYANSTQLCSRHPQVRFLLSQVQEDIWTLPASLCGEGQLQTPEDCRSRGERCPDPIPSPRGWSHWWGKISITPSSPLR